MGSMDYETPAAKPRSGRGLTKSLRYSFRSLLVAGVSQFKAGGVGGWLRSLLVAGVSRFKAGGVGGWLWSLLVAGVSWFKAGGVGCWQRSLFSAGDWWFSALAGVLFRRASTICHTAASQQIREIRLTLFRFYWLCQLILFIETFFLFFFVILIYYDQRLESLCYPKF